MAAVAKVAPMSAAEFLAWEPAEGKRWQLFDGEPRCMAPGSRTHGSIQGELCALIRNHLRASRSACVVVTEPGVVPAFQPDRNFRVPDLAVTCTSYVDEETVLADPVLIVEILSPSNRADTWANVRAYTSISSVREILVLESEAIAAHLLRRGEDGSWPARSEIIEAGELWLASIGLRVGLADVYATSRLAAADCRAATKAASASIASSGSGG